MKNLFFIFIFILMLSFGYSQRFNWNLSKADMDLQYYNSEPVWSPDGQQIAFVSRRDGGAELYLMNKDGSNIKRLTKGMGEISFPKFSPDGSKIIFACKRDGISQVYVANADGSNPVNLTQSQNNEYNPCWSPRGDKILFQSERDIAAQIYLMNIGGTNPKRVSAPLNYNNSEPQWSPDGYTLFFTSIKPPGDFKNSIADLRSDSCAFLSLEFGKLYILDCFSNDGKKILLHSEKRYSFTESSEDLFLYDIDTKTANRIKKNIDNMTKALFINDDSLLIVTSEHLYVFDIKRNKMHKIFRKVHAVQYSPKKNQILFELPGKKRDICTIRTDGSDFKNLTK